MGHSYYIYANIIVNLLMFPSTIIDLKYRRIPIYLFFASIPLTLAMQFYFKERLLFFLTGAIVMFAAYFLQALYSGGGGDVIMMSTLGLTLGLMPSLIIIIFSVPCVLFQVLFAKRKKQISLKDALHCEYPVAPSIYTGYIIYTGITILTTICS